MPLQGKKEPDKTRLGLFWHCRFPERELDPTSGGMPSFFNIFSAWLNGIE